MLSSCRVLVRYFVTSSKPTTDLTPSEVGHDSWISFPSIVFQSSWIIWSDVFSIIVPYSYLEKWIERWFSFRFLLAPSFSGSVCQLNSNILPSISLQWVSIIGCKGFLAPQQLITKMSKWVTIATSFLPMYLNLTRSYLNFLSHGKFSYGQEISGLCNWVIDALNSGNWSCDCGLYCWDRQETMDFSEFWR